MQTHDPGCAQARPYGAGERQPPCTCLEAGPPAVSGATLDRAEVAYHQLTYRDWSDPRACLERILGAALAGAKEAAHGQRL